MITKAKDYYDFLYRIQDVNAPSLATLLPKEENIYDNILTDTIPRKVKKQILKISPKLFYKIIK